MKWTAAFTSAIALSSAPLAHGEDAFCKAVTAAAAGAGDYASWGEGEEGSSGDRRANRLLPGAYYCATWKKALEYACIWPAASGTFVAVQKRIVDDVAVCFDDFSKTTQTLPDGGKTSEFLTPKAKIAVTTSIGDMKTNTPDGAVVIGKSFAVLLIVGKR